MEGLDSFLCCWYVIGDEVARRKMISQSSGGNLGVWLTIVLPFISSDAADNNKRFQCVVVGV